MILALALAAAAPATAPEGGTPIARCQAAIEKDAAAYVAEAEQQRALAGGALPDRYQRVCLGLGYAALEKWGPATDAFEGAARTAQIDGDKQAVSLWAQAGNAALALGDAARARTDLSQALASKELAGQMRGEVHIDRARAEVQAGDPQAARADLDEALKLVPDDPMGWLLSATLARREGNLERARSDIGEAIKRAPDDPAIAYEAGNVAHSAGAPEAARVAWSHAAQMDPDGPSGQAARLALQRLPSGDAPAPSPGPNPPPR